MSATFCLEKEEQWQKRRRVLGNMYEQLHVRVHAAQEKNHVVLAEKVKLPK